MQYDLVSCLSCSCWVRGNVSFFLPIVLVVTIIDREEGTHFLRGKVFTQVLRNKKHRSSPRHVIVWRPVVFRDERLKTGRELVGARELFGEGYFGQFFSFLCIVLSNRGGSEGRRLFLVEANGFRCIYLGPSSVCVSEC